MEVKEQLRNNFPSTINKQAEVFSALVVNDNGTAVIESELNYLISYMQEWIKTPDIYKQSGDMLDKSVNFFTYLEKFTDETENSLKNRVSSIFVRNHDLVWGTPNNIKQIFKQYFPSANVYLVENSDSIDENILDNGDFNTTSNWILKDCELSTKARFSKTYGIELKASSECSQSVLIDNDEAKSYFLHFFLKGNVKVIIKTNNNKYWNTKNNCWQSEIFETSFNQNEWENCSLWFSNFTESLNGRIIDESIESVEIKFLKGSGFLDYVRLFEKLNYSSFSIVAQFGGANSKGALSLTEGTNDPINSQSQSLPEWYKNASYYDDSFLAGVSAGFAQDIYNDLLKYVKVPGIKANIEIVNKDYIEDE